MQEQLVYLIGNAFRIYIYFKLLNTMFGTAKVKQIWIIIGFTVTANQTQPHQKTK